LRYQRLTAMTYPFAFHSRIPAPLLFIQLTQKEVHAMMLCYFAGFIALLADDTLTLMDAYFTHWVYSPLLFWWRILPQYEELFTDRSLATVIRNWLLIKTM
jgi:hypothetical protein